MSCTVEKVLTDARMLVSRLKDHDNSADNLITQSQTLQKRMDAMKQYQDDLNELNEIARHRPRANLIMGLLQENNQIRELQQENRELRSSLEEHQSAIELIMSKYREQVARLMMANKLDQGAKSTSDQSKEIEEKMDKICEMAVIMRQAIRLDEEQDVHDHVLMSQLKLENDTLRQLLHISNNSGSLFMDRSSQETQTDELSDVDTTGDECSRSVIYLGPDSSHDFFAEKADTESVSETTCKTSNDTSSDATTSAQSSPRTSATDPQGSPRTPATDPQGSPRTSATDPQGSPRTPATEPQGSPRTPASDTQGSPRASATVPQGSPRTPATDTQGSPRASATDPQGSPRTSGTDPQGSPRTINNSSDKARSSPPRPDTQNSLRASPPRAGDTDNGSTS